MYKQNVVRTHNGMLFSLERNQTLTQAPTWMNLEDIMQSNIDRYGRTNIVRFHFYKVTGAVRFIENRK